MKQDDSNILKNFGTDAGFKVPEGYFADFNKKMAESLPEIKITDADWVISDAHPAVTMDLVDSCRQVKKVFRNRIANLKNSFGVFTANVVLKPGALPYMNRNLFVHRHGADLWNRDYSRTDSIMVHFYPPENGHSRHAGCMDIL